MNQVDQMVQALESGKVVYAPRNFGKTTAIAKFLIKHPEKVAITPNTKQRDRLLNMLILLGLTEEQANAKIVFGNRTHETDQAFFAKNGVADEYMVHPYQGPCFATISSMPHGINEKEVVIFTNTGDKK